MSGPMQPFVFAAVALAVSLGLGVAAAPRGDVSLPEASPVASDNPASLERPFVLEVGGSATLEGGLWITFTSVLEDSRCPTDVQCVWEGNAEIAIEVGMADESAVLLSLNTNTGFATEATFGSYTISLVDLQPYPSGAVKTVGPYRASLVVSLVRDGPATTPDTSPSLAAS